MKKPINKKQQKQLQKRAEVFLEEFKLLSQKHNLGFQAFIQFNENGAGIIPQLRIIDITNKNNDATR